MPEIKPDWTDLTDHKFEVSWAGHWEFSGPKGLVVPFTIPSDGDYFINGVKHAGLKKGDVIEVETRPAGQR